MIPVELKQTLGLLGPGRGRRRGDCVQLVAEFVQPLRLAVFEGEATLDHLFEGTDVLAPEFDDDRIAQAPVEEGVSLRHGLLLLTLPRHEFTVAAEPHRLAVSFVSHALTMDALTNGVMLKMASGTSPPSLMMLRKIALADDALYVS